MLTAFQNEDREIIFNRRKIAKYIEDCHLADGGYFFAKVEPSSGLDTYLAVKTLRLLGVKTKNAKSVELFWKQRETEGNINDLFSIFLVVETFKELGLSIKAFRKFKNYLTDYYKRIIQQAPFIYSENERLSKKGFWWAMNYFSTMGKELEDLFYLVTLSHDLGLKIMNKKKIIKLIISLQNKNGGFGVSRESHLMTTYHALAILKLLSFDPPAKKKVFNYLMECWDNCNFLEDLYYIVEGLTLLRKPLPKIRKIIQFVESCQRGNGGFGRAPMMSIPTIEDTYRAVSIIKTCENYSHKKFLK
jgi:hypothetical protein